MFYNNTEQRRLPSLISVNFNKSIHCKYTLSSYLENSLLVNSRMLQHVVFQCQLLM